VEYAYLAAAFAFAPIAAGVISRRLSRRDAGLSSWGERGVPRHPTSCRDQRVPSNCWNGPVRGIGLLACTVPATAAFVTSGPALLVGCLLGWSLLGLALIDWRELVLPNVLTYPLLASGIAVAALEGSAAFFDRLLGSLIGGAAFFFLRFVYRAVRKSEGLGLGDVKLFAALGAWLGLEALPLLVVIGSLGGLASVAPVARRGVLLTATSPVPFGTFLALAGWLVWLHQRASG
jgi:prepilin signal peptidase PulO-like enzyme (type II secretory pathway)